MNDVETSPELESGGAGGLAGPALDTLTPSAAFDAARCEPADGGPPRHRGLAWGARSLSLILPLAVGEGRDRRPLCEREGTR